MKSICLSLPDETVARLDSAAEQFLRSRSGLVRVVLTQWLARAEIAPLAAETLVRLEPPTPEERHG